MTSQVKRISKSKSDFIKPFMDEWRWSKQEEKIVHDKCIGSVLHVCCGKSKLGDVRIDLFEKSDIKADAFHLPIKDRAFDTVVCDPPWNLGFNMKFWREIRRVAKKRILYIGLSSIDPGRGWSQPIFRVIERMWGFQLKVLCLYNKVGDLVD